MFFFYGKILGQKRAKPGSVGPGNSTEQRNWHLAQGYRDSLVLKIKESLKEYKLNKDFKDYCKNNILKNDLGLEIKFKENEAEYYLGYYQYLAKDRVLTADQSNAGQLKAYYVIKSAQRSLEQEIYKNTASEIVIDNFKGSSEFAGTEQEIFRTMQDIFIPDKALAPEEYLKAVCAKLGLAKQQKTILEDIQAKTKEILAAQGKDLVLNSTAKQEMLRRIGKLYLLYVYITGSYGLNKFKYQAIDDSQKDHQEYSAFELWTRVRNGENPKAYCQEISALLVAILRLPIFADCVSTVQEAAPLMEPDGYYLGGHIFVSVQVHVPADKAGLEKKINLNIDPDAGRKLIQGKEAAQGKFACRADTSAYTYQQLRDLQARLQAVTNDIGYVFKYLNKNIGKNKPEELAYALNRVLTVINVSPEDYKAFTYLVDILCLNENPRADYALVKQVVVMASDFLKSVDLADALSYAYIPYIYKIILRYLFLASTLKEPEDFKQGRGLLSGLDEFCKTLDPGNPLLANAKTKIKQYKDYYRQWFEISD